MIQLVAGWCSWFALQAQPVRTKPPPAETDLVRQYGDKQGVPSAPFVLPCIFNVAQYRKGGEGVGYHDTTPGNKPGPHIAYTDRNDDVDLDWAYWDDAKGSHGSTCSAGCGVANCWGTAGEWLAYEITSEVTWMYTFTLRVCNGAGKGPVMHLEIDGVNVSGDLEVPGTPDWHHFTDLETNRLPSRRELIF